MGVNLTIRVPDFGPELTAAFSAEFAKVLPGVARETQAWARAELKASLQLSPTYHSLISGTLREEFGLQNPADVNGVIDEVAKGVVARTILPSSRSLGGVRVDLMAKSLQIIAATPHGRYISSPSGREVPWLEWLLLEGPRVILTGVELLRTRKPRPGSSRTGYTIMVKRSQKAITRRQGRLSNKDLRSKGLSKKTAHLAQVVTWGVPPEWAGTEGDNWIVNSISSVIPGVQGKVEQLLAAI
jgi:hypothetical protein